MSLFSSFRSIATKRPWLLQCRSFQSSVRQFDPLRILFCGSDEFSVASLQALDKERLAKSSADIESIDVVCRPGKPTGTGLKVIRHLPIRETAKQLELPIHEIDTFTGWQPPPGINLIIAVSFGLFVPPRILNGAKYGGLNVHPSMLPDLRGPAPIHWTILLGRKHTGITLQTLHPSKIDHGTILAQTAVPGMDYPTDATVEELITFLAQKGENLLVQGLKYRVFESEDPIIHSESEILEITDGKGIAHAPKITSKHRQIDTWENLDADSLLRKDQALGSLWDTVTYQTWAQQCRKEFPKSKDESIPTKRVIFSGGFEEFTHQRAEDANQVVEDAEYIRSILSTNPAPGQLIFLPRKRWLPKELLVVASDKKLLRVKSCTLEGGQKENGAKELYSVLVSHREAFGRLQKRLKNKGVKKKELMQRAKDRKAATTEKEEETPKAV